MKNLAAVSLLLVAALAGACRGGSAAPGTKFRTGKVERGEVVEGVASSGTVQPVVLVQVGTQVSGVVEKLLVDFNSKVTAGQTIALLDSRRLAAQVDGDEAAIGRARAEVDRSRAAVVQAKAELERVRAQVAQAAAEVDRVGAQRTLASKDLDRQKSLAARKLTSPADLDAAEAALGAADAQAAGAVASRRQAEAQVAVAESSVHQSEAQAAVSEAAVKQAEAQIASDRVNLAYATITSPVDGVVVSRNVDVGQTVAASLSAPTLFVIAQDLTKIQVQTSVPEADIGRLRVGQETRFTVDAHPDRSFRGAVSQVRLAATTVQNVVTYTVIVDASNPDGLLLPGMTADVTFEIARSAPDSLRVPATALRLQAPPELVDGTVKTAGDPKGEPAPKEEPSAKGEPSPKGEGPPKGDRAGKREHGPKGSRASREGVVYLQAPGNRLRPVAVRPGISDGAWTVVEPVTPGDLAEGAEVVTAVVKAAEETTTNPFAPPRMGGGTRGGAPRGAGGR